MKTNEKDGAMTVDERLAQNLTVTAPEQSAPEDGPQEGIAAPETESDSSPAQGQQYRNGQEVSRTERAEVFGRLLRAARRFGHKTRHEVARCSGLTIWRIRHLEFGTADAVEWELRAFATAVGVPPDLVVQMHEVAMSRTGRTLLRMAVSLLELVDELGLEDGEGRS